MTPLSGDISIPLSASQQTLVHAGGRHVAPGADVAEYLRGHVIARVQAHENLRLAERPLLHASRHPVSACIAMAPHVLVEDIAVQAIAQATVAFESGGLRERLARHHADVDVAFWQWNDVWLSEGFRGFDIREDCRRISAPLLLVQGIDDEYGTMRQLDEIALAAPHAQQLRLAACGHSPQRDQAGETVEAIAGFLKAVD